MSGWDETGSPYVLATTVSASARSAGETETTKFNRIKRFVADVITEINDYRAHKAASASVHGITNAASLLTSGSSLDPSKINGTVPLAKLGGGTPGAGKYVDGGTGNWTTLPGSGAGISLNDVTAAFGMIWVDAYSGTDSAKLASAWADAKAQDALTGVTPVMVLSPRVWTFTTQLTVDRNGFKLSGPNISNVGGPLSGSPWSCKVRLNMGSTPWLVWSGTYFGGYIGNIHIEGVGSSSLAFRSVVGIGNCSATVFQNIGCSNLMSLFGDSTNLFGMTACVFNGYWNINNGLGISLNLGGSDCTLFPDGALIDSNPSTYWVSPYTNKYHLRLSLEKTYIGPVYITAHEGSAALIEGGSSNQGSLFCDGWKIEGRNATSQCRGALVRQSGTGVVWNGCWFGYGMASPSTGANSGDAGIYHQTGGKAAFIGCTYGRGFQSDDATAVAVTTPFLYATGSSTEASITRLQRGNRTNTVALNWGDERPTVTVASGADVSIDNYGPTGFRTSGSSYTPSGRGPVATLEGLGFRPSAVFN